MKIAVIGSRYFKDIQLLEQELKKLKISFIFSGGAIGADSLAIVYAKKNKIGFKIIRPDYAKFGRAAPIIRNLDIIKDADLVLAFWDGKSKGTADAILKAKKLNKPFRVIHFSHS